MAQITISSIHRVGNLVMVAGTVDDMPVNIGIDIAQVQAAAQPRQFVAQQLVNSRVSPPIDLSSAIPLGSLTI